MRRSLLRPILGLATCLVAGSVAQAQVHLYEFPGENPSMHFGQCVAGAGDLDGDGVPDVLAGSQATGPSTYGVVGVYSGRAGGVLYTLQSGAPDDGFGATLASLGDVDGDGFPDFAVGIPRSVVPSGYPRGRVRVYSGRTGSLRFSVNGGPNGWGLGCSVAATGDVDGDGLSDFVAGAVTAGFDETTFLGKASVFSGWNGALIHALDNGNGIDGFGAAVAGPGDVDGDGIPDILVGEPYNDANGRDAGAAYLFSGLDGSRLRTFLGPSAGARFGVVAAAGDVDGDGHLDLAVGAPGDSTNGLSSGTVTIFSGLDGSVLRVLRGETGQQLGSSVVGGQDVDGDHVPDLVASAPIANTTFSQTGQIEAFSGRTGALLFVIPGSSQGERLGSIAWAGDLNHDGAGDLVVGSPRRGDAGSEQGGVGVYLLGTSPPLNLCFPKYNSLGCGSTLAYRGAPSLSVGDNFFVTTSGLLNRTLGRMVWSTTRASIPFGGGLLCVQPDHFGRILDTGGSPNPATDCTGAIAVPFSIQFFESNGLVPGTRIHCQFVSRDPGFPAPFNVGLTDSMAFTVLP